MRLLLTSGGLTNFSINTALEDLARERLQHKNIAFIPTASTLGAGDKRWFIRDLVNVRRLGFKEIDIVEISGIPEQVWLPRLKHADILLFSGGNTSHLMYWLKKSGLEKALPELLKTRIYVGISAGSIVATKSLALSSQQKKDFAKELGEYVGEDGLGYVNFHIRPHLNSPQFPSITIPNLEKRAMEIKEPIYAIDDDTAIKVVDDSVEVVSEGQWKRFN